MPKTAKPSKTRASNKASTSKSKGKRTADATSAEAESSWPASNLKADSMITLRYAKERYALEDKDLAGLPRNEPGTVLCPWIGLVATPTLRQRDVEFVAWRKYGGPDGLHDELERLKTVIEPLDIPLPEDESESQLWPLPEAFLSMTLRDQVRYSTGKLVGPGESFDRDTIPLIKKWACTAKLRELKRQYVPWVWTAAARAMAMNPWPVHDDEHKESIFLIGTLDLFYPERPETALPSSPSVDALRAVLAEAPEVRAGEADDDGIEWRSDIHDDESAIWADSYLERLFPAFVEVVYAHGTGLDGWETIRWEIYDRYTECIFGIQYVEGGRDTHWKDDAQRWLVGRTNDYVPDWYDRHSPLCQEYESLLPFTDRYGR